MSSNTETEGVDPAGVFAPIKPPREISERPATLWAIALAAVLVVLIAWVR